MFKKILLITIILSMLMASMMQLRAASGVIGNGKGAGLADVTVIIGKNIKYETGSDGYDRVTGCIAGNKTHTDANGKFKLNIPSGKYDILVWKAGYTPQIDYNVSIAGYTTDILYDNQGKGLHQHLSVHCTYDHLTDYLAGKWDSNWGTVTLLNTEPTTGSWEQGDGKTGQFSKGIFDPVTSVFYIHYYQPWNKAEGWQKFILSDDGKTLEGHPDKKGQGWDWICTRK